MMALTNTSKPEGEKRVAVRMPKWLHDMVQESADLSGWDISKQIRLELAAARGKGVIPSIPQERHAPRRFKGPTHDASGSRKKRRR